MIEVIKSCCGTYYFLASKGAHFYTRVSEDIYYTAKDALEIAKTMNKMKKPSTQFTYRGVYYDLTSKRHFKAFEIEISNLDFVAKVTAKKAWATALTSLDRLTAKYNRG